MKKLLIIGRTFPEPSTTAAGTRMMQLIALFKEQDYNITFASTAAKSRYSENLGEQHIHTLQIALNADSFDVFITSLAPDVVLFDRYISEEHFGWRVAAHAPNALRILDTEDLHFLRDAREKSFKNNESFHTDMLFSVQAQREIASILRCDISLMISEVEVEILLTHFSMDENLLCYLPFLIETNRIIPKHSLPSFTERKDFITIGNFHHKPNVDAVLYLKKEIWPLIRKKLPKAALHIYGAYAKQHILELHNEKEGFLIKGWAKNVDEVMQQAKVCIAPVRFGAGLKGKLLDALCNATPVVSTPVGVEGMYGAFDVPGEIGVNAEEIANAAIKLYTNEETWKNTLKKRASILTHRFAKEKFSQQFLAQINEVQTKLLVHRNKNFVGQILQSETCNSIRFKSKWIEEKNK